MLVHICCAVDSHYFLQKLREEYPQEKLIGFFYDPNIHPYSEYTLRLLDVKRSCHLLDIPLIEGPYDVESWLKAVRGLENEPEKGSRCSVCFDRRFEVTAQKAAALGESSFTSTLLTSPKKSLTQLRQAGEALGRKYHITFVAPDYRKASGTQAQNILAKQDQLYRQDYCGCLFGLTMQRDAQQRLADELFSPLSKQIQPASIEERLLLYQERVALEERDVAYRIVKERFLNWRILGGWLKVRKEVRPVHFLPYSTLKKEYTRGRIEYTVSEIHYMGRDEVRFLTLAHYNRLAGTRYNKTAELLYHPPRFEEELKVRETIANSAYDAGAILVVDTVPETKIEISLRSHTYMDVRETLVLLC